MKLIRDYTRSTLFSSSTNRRAGSEWTNSRSSISSVVKPFWWRADQTDQPVLCGIWYQLRRNYRKPRTEKIPINEGDGKMSRFKKRTRKELLIEINRVKQMAIASEDWMFAAWIRDVVKLHEKKKKWTRKNFYFIHNQQFTTFFVICVDKHIGLWEATPIQNG